jgi:hypothetical protein
MKIKIITTALLLGSALVCFAAIAELTGKWAGVLKLADGSEYSVSYVFKIDGNKLIGSVTTEQGELPLVDGKIKGNDFSFKLNVNAIIIENTGKYYGDSTIIDANFNGQNMRTKLTRADK